MLLPLQGKLFLLIITAVSIKSMLVIPPQVRSVCPREKITFFCSTNESVILRWTVTIPKANNITYLKNVPSTGSGLLPVITHQTVHNTAVFNFSRPSESGSFPFTTTLIIDGISNDLNGTEIVCLGLVTPLPVILNHTIILVKEASSISPKISIREVFEIDNVTVILDIIQEEGVMYTVHINPLISLMLTRNNEYQFTVPYNTDFNVSVKAIVCGHTSATYTFTMNYTKCSYPLVDYMGILMDDIHANDTGLKVPGTNISFSCPPGLELNGIDMTCSKNGEWDPDPRDVICIKDNSSPTFCALPLPPSTGYIRVQNADLVTKEGSNNITFVCQNGTSDEEAHSSVCTSAGKWQPNPREFCSSRIYEKSRVSLNYLAVVGSIAVLIIVTSVFIFGGLFIFHRKQTAVSSMDHSLPIYEDIGEAFKHKQYDLELSANASYAPIRL